MDEVRIIETNERPFYGLGLKYEAYLIVYDKKPKL
jgi:predicted nucleic acid-binding protein